ncbi:ATP-dependent DNA helicase [uncultured Methylibium sp.]|uniref:ATP-dependent DNA helicase n=1 Tax=uncultured Methylibium sp. TaxID=381093 RepID=UPI0025F52C88|nr:ATP-dependent DNA helicase [uncultured Methylibium sp.]
MTVAVALPSELREAVARAFAGAGPLAEADPAYRERAGQLELAQAVADAIDERSVLVAEAGTGVGKTFAYLVPALLAGRRTLVSTATKSLQDQLFLRDLPRLRDLLQLPVTVALLKGRSSYLCLQRLTQARQAEQLPDRWAARTLAKIEQWAQRSGSGDLAELEGLDERSPVIPLVTSTRENCLGSECPEYRNCHVMKARREAMAADLVVVNHHLFFADLSLRDTGMAELLPSVDVAVFDEAHQLTEAGVAFLGSTLGSAQAIDFARDTLAAGLGQARGLQPWQELAAACERAARELRLAAVGPLRDVRGSLKLRWDDRAGRGDFQAAMQALGAACAAAGDALGVVREVGPDFDKLAERASTLASRAAAFAEEAEPGKVRWIDLTPQGVRLVESPLDVRDAMREQVAAAPKAWVFTSATLGADARLAWFTEQAGLDDARTLRVDSPFDYPAHARLYVPARFPKPNESGHPAAVARLAAACARAAGGRTFVLTTTLRALASIGEALQVQLVEGEAPIEVLVQGSAPKRQLLQRFLDTPRAVLVGSQSFWEGIDVPGDALQCVIIDKLPFPPPNDPLVEARVRRLESEGRNAFNDYFVAEAAVSLKQGAGRLIRSETDRGLLVICDPRMAAMGYGNKLRAALPPMPALREQDEALAWLEEIAG